MLRSWFTRPFLLMFSILFLLNMNFTVLRSIRNTLAVVDWGGGAQTIPLFELCGVLPGAVIMTWALAAALRRFSIQNVFYLALGGFLLFFVAFACIGYPFLSQCACAPWMLQLASLAFYVVAELWKPALIHILFWGLINRITSLQEASRLYGPLILGASLGSIVAGPLVMGCTSEACWQVIPLALSQWTHAFILMTLLLGGVGVVTGVLYWYLYQTISGEEIQESKKPSITLRESVRLCFRSQPLALLSWVILADYIAYTLGEVIFLEVLREKFPAPCDFCYYMGQLAFWSSLLTVVSAGILAPLCLRYCRWVVAALALPVALLVIEGAFFFVLRMQGVSGYFFGWNYSQWIGVVVTLGSIQFCVCRALKYTFFDASKEMVYVVLPKEEQIKGKLVIDGICARLGRGGASALSLGFIALSGGIIASSFIAGTVAIGMTGSWIFATQKLSRFFSLENKWINRQNSRIS